MYARAWLLFGALLLACLEGCGENTSTRCVEGTSNECACSSGLKGAQVCTPNGTFGSCQCDLPIADAGASDGGTAFDSGVDGGGSDSGMPDAGAADAGPLDAGAADAGHLDAGAPDAGAPDAGAPDAGALDAGAPDAGALDAGASDAGASDAGASDGGPSCLIGNGGCDALTSCTLSDAGVTCGSCPSGFSGTGATSCVDINECLTNNGACDALTTCTNTFGGRTCGACPSGYSGTGASSCADINECLTNNGNCDTLTICTNTSGGRTCGACPSGYTGTGATSCADINECLTNNGGCDTLTICTNTSGGRTCGACPSGYTGTGATSCVDVNECLTNNGACDTLTTCTNTSGGRTCGACPSGYTGTGATSCVDVNECLSNNGNCDALTTCTNTAGARTCGACPSGYTGTGATSCVDINECLTNNGNCDALTTCTNTSGGRTCSGCPSGYTGTGATSCVDINECLTGNGGCNSNASCANTPGSRTCTCNVGYAGNGLTCATVCGDNTRAGAEQCDDGNLVQNDGCSTLCRTEIRWSDVGVSNPSASNFTYLRAGSATANYRTGSATNFTDSYKASTMDSAGAPIVAGCDNSTGAVATVYRWQSSSGWASLGAIPSFSCFSGELKLTTSNAGQIYAAFSTGAVRTYQAGAWVDVGNTGTGQSTVVGGLSNIGGIVVDSAGRIVVAWKTSDFHVYLRRWDGLAWSELAGSASGGGVSGASIVDSVFEPKPIRVFAGDAGSIFVTWHSNLQLEGRYFNGTSWQNIGPTTAIPGVGFAETYDAILSGTGQLTILYEKLTASGTDVSALTWDGFAWSSLAPLAGSSISSTPNSLSRFARLGFDSDGSPIATWTEYYESSSTFVRGVWSKIWTGTDWVPLGQGLAQGTGVYQGYESRIVSFPSQRPCIIFGTLGGSSASTFFRCFNGTELIERGPAPLVTWPSPTPQPGTSPTILYRASGSLVVAGDESVKEFSGSWTSLGPSVDRVLGITGLTLSRNLAVTEQPDGTLVLARAQSAPTAIPGQSSYRLYVFKWTGSTWVEFSPGSASGNGLYSFNAAANWSGNVSLTAGTGQNIFLGYTDFSSGTQQLLRYDGISWQDFAGSPRFGGCSGQIGKVTVDSNGVPWLSCSSTGLTIYRWNGAQWAVVGANPLIAAVAPVALVASPGGVMDLIYWTGLPSINHRRWNGTAWLPATVAATNSSAWTLNWASGATSIAGRLVVVFGGRGANVVGSYTSDIGLRYFDGSSWQELEGARDGFGISYSDAHEGYAFVACKTGECAIAYDQSVRSAPWNP